MLKWIIKEAHVSDMFNCALQHGMPHDWSINRNILVHKGGDINKCKLVLDNHSWLSCGKALWMYNGS